MPDVRSIISEKPITGYFILDSKQEGKGGGEYEKEVNFDFYLYKPKRFGKLKEDSVFLYRLPGGSAVDRKFSIYGGGRIESISDPDENGTVRATITEGFRFVRPLKQGDKEIESIQWTSRTRKPMARNHAILSWEHCFSQYGMNAITEDEFWALAADQECVAVEAHNTEEEAARRSEAFLLEETSTTEYTLIFSRQNNGGKARRGRPKKIMVGNFIDYKRLYDKTRKIGELGEVIAYNYECDKLRTAGIENVPVHVSKVEGDGLGYDIRSWSEDGKEVHIEVKTTISRSTDGFDITSAEVEASKDPNYVYKIYRIYDLDPLIGTAKICIYEGPITDQDFELVPTSFKLYKK